MSYLFVVSMDVDPAHEEIFNEVYDNEHVPFLMEVEGVHRVTRGKSVPFALSIGGERKEIGAASPRYTAIYEIDSPEVLASDAWAEAIERGRWPKQVRPHTSNRQHAVFKTD